MSGKKLDVSLEVQGCLKSSVMERLCFCSCMKTLSHPLLDVQIWDPDTLPLSPLRTFAAEILVWIVNPACLQHGVVFEL